MAIIDLRGDVARSLASIGQSIGGILDPDKASRKRFQEMLASNPALAKALGRIEREAPGTLQNILPFDIDEEIISGLAAIPPSVAELGERPVRRALTPKEEGGVLTPEVSAILGQFGVAGMVGAKPAELALEPKRVAAAEAIPQEAVTAGERRRITGLTPGQTAQDAWNTEIFNTAMDSFNALEMEEADIAVLRTKLPAVFFDEDNQRLFGQRKAIAQMQIDAQNLDRANERTDAFQRSVGARWTERTKTGTPETWKMFLFTEGMNERGKGLAAGTILPQNQTDIRLKEVADAFARADQVDKGMEEAAIKTQIGVLVGRINRRDSEGKFTNERTVRLMLLEQLNSSIIELANLTDGRVQLGKIDKSKMDFIPFVGPGNLPLTFEDTTVAPTQPGQREIGQQRDQDVTDFLDSLGQAEQPEQVEEVGPLNPQTVDMSKLPQKTRDNFIAIMNGQGTFEQLQAFDPVSAQLILDARRNR